MPTARTGPASTHMDSTAYLAHPRCNCASTSSPAGPEVSSATAPPPSTAPSASPPTSAAAGPGVARGAPPRRRRSRSSPARSVDTASRVSWSSEEDDPSPDAIVTTASPYTRCSTRALASTRRTRSRGTDRCRRFSTPVRTSTRPSVTRYQVVPHRHRSPTARRAPMAASHVRVVATPATSALRRAMAMGIGRSAPTNRVASTATMRPSSRCQSSAARVGAGGGAGITSRRRGWPGCGR